MSVALPPAVVRELGHQPYAGVYEAMQTFTRERTAATADEFWVVEHDPVFTQGQAGKAEHVLAAGDIPVLQTDRGGQVTYHGPGQIVIYVLVDLRRAGLGVKRLVGGIEQAMIDTLATFDVRANTRDGAPGVYLGPTKIGALGLRVRRGCSYHGLSLNLTTSLEPFSRINPCGLTDTRATRLIDVSNRARSLAAEALWQEVQDRLLAGLSAAFGLSLEAKDTKKSGLAPA
ncbi:MAG: lipoyl(octanoyl) transferase LipB [Pseudomonadota bacterium]